MCVCMSAHAHVYKSVCVRVYVNVMYCMCGGQRTMYRSEFSPSTMWVWGIELSSTGFVAGTSPH